MLFHATRDRRRTRSHKPCRRLPWANAAAPSGGAHVDNGPSSWISEHRNDPFDLQEAIVGSSTFQWIRQLFFPSSSLALSLVNFECLRADDAIVVIGIADGDINNLNRLTG